MPEAVDDIHRYIDWNPWDLVTDGEDGNLLSACQEDITLIPPEFHPVAATINDWKDLTDQECENLNTEADDLWITLNGWNSSQILHSDLKLPTYSGET